jgi:hypothetical protein
MIEIEQTRIEAAHAQPQPATEDSAPDSVSDRDITVVVAAWPVGVSALTLAANICRQQDIVLPFGAPKTVPPPAF